MSKAQERPASYTELAEVAYVAYAKSAKNKNYQGKPMPAWDELPPRIRQHWIAAMVAVVEHSGAL